ncbi:MAG: hypothetical protein PWQ57_2705, partial [Desulfovibrionales bacterium]|nr:hypothetical protein [Desulfovibrionales bacterium]
MPQSIRKDKAFQGLEGKGGRAE